MSIGRRHNLELLERCRRAESRRLKPVDLDRTNARLGKLGSLQRRTFSSGFRAEQAAPPSLRGRRGWSVEVRIADARARSVTVPRRAISRGSPGRLRWNAERMDIQEKSCNSVRRCPCANGYAGSGCAWRPICPRLARRLKSRTGRRKPQPSTGKSRIGVSSVASDVEPAQRSESRTASRADRLSSSQRATMTCKYRTLL